jgi:hypothetical protein
LHEIGCNSTSCARAGLHSSDETLGQPSDSFKSSIANYLARLNPSKDGPVPKLITKLAVKNGIVDVELLNDPEIPPALGKFSGEVDYGRAETFRVVTGSDTEKERQEDTGQSRRDSCF